MTFEVQEPLGDWPQPDSTDTAANGDAPDVKFFQHVHAVAGFAYGVIGADIHVFANGTPVYLLFGRRGAIEADAGWMRAQPSRMLDARAEVVEFTGREAELRELVAWRKTEPRLSVRLLHGEGGQGKTRLAAKFADDSERAGWKVVYAVHGTDAHPPEPGSQDLRLDGSKGVLLIVDYADRWPLTDLSWLFHNMLLRQSIPARVLLVGRSAAGWRATCGRLDQFRLNIDHTDQLLTPLADDGRDREHMFGVARDCFARHYPQLGEPGRIEPPGPLDRADYGLTLMIHMAALVAVDAAARGRKPPADPIGLTTYLLDREYENWKQLYENRAGGLGYRTPDAVMARAVFVSALCGPVDRAEAPVLLEGLLPGPDLRADSTAEQGVNAGRDTDVIVNTETVVADHAVCYPPAEPAAALVPMLPDRLAEDFLALMIPGHAITGFPGDPWAAAVPRALLSAPQTAGYAPPVP